jgi:high-affinity iron transporter
MPTLTAEPRRTRRRLLPVYLGLLSAVAGFFVLTAIGVGGNATTTTPPAPASQRELTALQAYSHAAALREGAGNVAGARPVAELVPVPPSDFDRPIAESLAYAGVQLRAMAIDVRQLTGALATGDRARSRAIWLTAFARYLRLGAVYGEFGALDTAIDGGAGGLAGGTANPRFSGLHRLEFGLWTSQSVRSLVPVAQVLGTNIRRLELALGSTVVTPLDYATRAHEILEDAQRDFLSGTDVPWSGEGVFATVAAVAATEEILNTLRPLLDARESVIEQVDFALAGLRRVLTQIRSAHGGVWPTNGQLNQLESERLDGALGFALEQLAGVPGDLETQAPPAIPPLPAQAGER